MTGPAPPDHERLSRLVAALPADRFAHERWWADKGRHVRRLTLVEAVRLPPGDGAEHLLLVLAADFASGPPTHYLLPAVDAQSDLREPRDGEGIWRALVQRLAAGGDLPGDRGVLCFAATPALAAAAVAGRSERRLACDQSNTSVVVDERVLLKCFRRLEPGAHPEVEAGRALEGFPHVPAFMGAIELRAPGRAPVVLAVAHAFLPDAADAYEAIAEELAARLRRRQPAVAPDDGTEAAQALGVVVGRLHLALAGRGRGGRRTDDETLLRWRRGSERALAAVVGLLPPPEAAELAALAPAIRRRLAAFEAGDRPVALTPVHGDLHLGQVLRTPAGFVLVDFEGDPLLPLAERARPQPALRDVATLLRSFDHVARSAARRSGGGDVEAWIERARGRLLAAYRQTVGAERLDLGLLRALEVHKELSELRYAATVLPSWLWAPMSGLRALLGVGTGTSA